LNLDEVLRRCRDDPAYFCQLFFRFIPYMYQIDFWHAAITYKKLALLWGRGSGKTTAVSILVLWYALTHLAPAWNPTKIVIAAGKGIRQSKIMFDALSSILRSSPILMNSVNYMTRTEIHFGAMKDGVLHESWIIVVPTGHDGSVIRGHHPAMVILDEACFMRPYIIESVVYPMLNIKLPDGSSKTLIMLTTPWGRNHPFRSAYMDPDYWKAKIRSIDCPNADQAWLVKQKMNNPYLYKIENDCDWPDEESAWLRMELLLRVMEDYGMIDEFSVRNGKVDTGFAYRHFVGVDLGKKESYTVITVWREESWKDGKTIYRLIYFKRFDRIGDLPKELQKDYDLYREVEEHLKKVVSKFNVVWLGVDLGAAGEGEIEHFRQFFPKAEGISLSEPKKRDVASWMRSLMENGRVRIPTHPDVISMELNSEQFEEREAGTIHFYPAGDEKYKNPDDVFWSAGLGLYGTKPETPERPPFSVKRV